MEDSIFTRIINGDIPSHKVYEDESTYAFLDIHPASEGHTLVVPKKQVEFVWDLDNDTYQALMTLVKKVAGKLRETYPDRYVAEMVIGVDVPHAHVHLIPFAQASELQDSFTRPMSEPDHTHLASIAKKLAIS